jgi:hypothetical protein
VLDEGCAYIVIMFSQGRTHESICIVYRQLDVVDILALLRGGNERYS